MLCRRNLTTHRQANGVRHERAPAATPKQWTYTPAHFPPYSIYQNSRGKRHWRTKPAHLSEFLFCFACNVERGTRSISPCRVLGSAQKPPQAAVQKQTKLKATTHTRACRVSQVPPSRIFLFHFVHSTFSQAQRTGMHEESMITTQHYTHRNTRTHNSSYL